MNSPFSIEPKINAWINLVRSAGCTIRKIKPLSLTRRKNGELLFALLDADIRSPEGHSLPNIVFIRGDACLIVPLVRNRVTGEERFLMVRQRRIGSGKLSLEFPAGMLDNDVSDPPGVAARELAEETGLRVGAADLFPLCEKKLFSSVGACDEGIYYYGCVKEIDETEWRSFAAGPSAGNPEENERISVALMTRGEAEKEASSLQVHLGMYLFDAYGKKNAGFR
ncbi:MAG: NUDIX hydrolase [Chitinispirillaceae bacterium]|nr:NUDIX hydrolase [Chitinispirillaceae bacterium]